MIPKLLTELKLTVSVHVLIPPDQHTMTVLISQLAYCCLQGIGPRLSFPAWLRGAEGSNHRYLQPLAWLLCHGSLSPGLGTGGDIQELGHEHN